MTTACIIQARLGSSRLPAKVLLPLPTWRNVLQEVVFRAQQIEGVDIVVVAIPDTPENDIIAEAVEKMAYGFTAIPTQIALYRGPEHDVLARYLQAAESVAADVIVRITADCPLLDPEVCTAALRKLQDEDLDYCSNCHPRTFPKGLDVECFTMEALKRAEHFAKSDDCREHVSLYMYTTEGFVRGNYTQAEDQSKTRLTLDTIEDYVTIWNEFKRREDHAPH